MKRAQGSWIKVALTTLIVCACLGFIYELPRLSFEFNYNVPANRQTVEHRMYHTNNPGTQKTVLTDDEYIVSPGAADFVPPQVGPGSR